MWFIKSLKLQGFRSFTEETIVSFPMEGAFLVLGIGPNGIPVSGTGKSSAFMAIAYALGFKCPPATELKSRYAKKMFVELTLGNKNGEETVITRSPKLQVTAGGTVTTGQDAERVLEGILGLNSNIAEVISYRAQGSASPFVSSTDSSKKEFLASILNLQAFEDEYAKLGQIVTDLESRVQSSQQNLSLQDNFIASMADAESFLEKSKSDYESVYQSHTLKPEESQKVNELKTKLINLDSQLQKIRTVRYQIVTNDDRNAQIEKYIAQQKEKVEFLRSNKCPTCKQEWDNAEEEIKKIITAVEEKKKEYKSNLDYKAQAGALLNSEPQISYEDDKVRNEIANISAALNKRDDMIRMANAALKNAHDQYEKLIRTKTQRETTYGSLLELEDQLKASRTAKMLIGREGFLGTIFDQILNEIESEANNFIGQLPNISKYSVSINGESATKSGTTKQSISIKLFADGHEVSLISLSGGQRKSLDLCVDLAIRNIVHHRSGTKVGWYMLDEAMDGLDSNTKEHAINMIVRATVGQVFVIDHTTEVQEGFSKVIKVVFDGQNSIIQGG
jgi:DNA repair exonuclease SbcCD ATPase subunit